MSELDDQRSKLVWPLKNHLECEPSAEAVRRAQVALHTRLFENTNSRRVRSYVYLPLLAAAVALFGWLFWPASMNQDTPLRLANGLVFEGLNAETSGNEHAKFSDGSSIHAYEGTALESLGSDHRKVVTLLSKGKATFSVIPGGKRQWVVEAGLLSVEVVGTIFTVERNSERVAVSVVRGTVLVRSAQLPNGIVRLGAGDTVEVQDTSFPRAFSEANPKFEVQERR